MGFLDKSKDLSNLHYTLLLLIQGKQNEGKRYYRNLHYTLLLLIQPCN